MASNAIFSKFCTPFMVQYQAMERHEHTLIWLSSLMPGGRSSVCLRSPLLQLASTLWLPMHNHIRQCCSFISPWSLGLDELLVLRYYGVHCMCTTCLSCIMCLYRLLSSRQLIEMNCTRTLSKFWSVVAQRQPRYVLQSLRVIYIHVPTL